MDRRERQVRQLIVKAGLSIVKIDHSSTSRFRARVQRGDGTEENVTFSASPSSQRSEHAALPLLRRIARGHTTIVPRNPQ